MSRPSVCWFRRDLRLADNPALAAAAADGPVVPLFVLDPVFLTRAGAPRLAFLLACLRSLDASMGGALVVRHGDPAAVVPTFAADLGAVRVVAADDGGVYGQRRDALVAARLRADGRHLTLTGSPYAVPPGRVRKGDGTPYAVFTPFRRTWEATGWDAPQPAPSVDWLGAPDVSCDGIPALAAVEALPETVRAALPAPGEAAAHDRLDVFLVEALAGYREQRDLPALDGTSRLSAHLRFGTVHPRQVLAHLGDGPGASTFRSELAWREFYADVWRNRPRSGWHNLQQRMDAMALDTDAAARRRFAAWAAGRTGYPFVDAGMRQLLATGWMHNRVRMVVASFLVKDLHLPWQWGAAHFLRHLVDGDLASNNHGWQWAAGTGTDAAPYFRVFNPVSQGQKFDPAGAYVRHWVPELAVVADRYVHAPWTAPQGLPLGAEGPMVDHATERDEALARYAATGAA